MPADNSGFESVTRREARSGKVSFGDAVILHETSRSRVQLVPFFIPRSSGTDLAVKIVTYAKKPALQDWALVEEKAVTLDEPASRRLLDALRKHLAVSDEDGDGEYIVIHGGVSRRRDGDRRNGSVPRSESAGHRPSSSNNRAQ